MTLEEQKQQAQLSQAQMMARFKQTSEYLLMKNTFEIMRLIWSKKRMKLMEAQSTREICLYYTGKEDAVMELLESIDKIIADGEAIKQANEVMANYQED